MSHRDSLIDAFLAGHSDAMFMCSDGESMLPCQCKQCKREYEAGQRAGCEELQDDGADDEYFEHFNPYAPKKKTVAHWSPQENCWRVPDDAITYCGKPVRDVVMASQYIGEPAIDVDWKICKRCALIKESRERAA